MSTCESCREEVKSISTMATIFFLDISWFLGPKVFIPRRTMDLCGGISGPERIMWTCLPPGCTKTIWKTKVVTTSLNKLSPDVVPKIRKYRKKYCRHSGYRLHFLTTGLIYTSWNHAIWRTKWLSHERNAASLRKGTILPQNQNPTRILGFHRILNEFHVWQI